MSFKEKLYFAITLKFILIIFAFFIDTYFIYAFNVKVRCIQIMKNDYLRE